MQNYTYFFDANAKADRRQKQVKNISFFVALHTFGKKRNKARLKANSQIDAYGEVKPVLFDRVIDKNLIKVYKYNSQLIKNI